MLTGCMGFTGLGRLRTESGFPAGVSTRSPTRPASQWASVAGSSAAQAIAPAIIGQTLSDRPSGRMVARFFASPGRARQASGSSSVIMPCSE
jgi:hypothetical protein